MEKPPQERFLVTNALGQRDTDVTTATLMVTNLHATLTKLEQTPSGAYAEALRFLAWQTYEAVLGLLPSLSTSEEQRQWLAAQIAALKVRLMQMSD